MCTCAPVLASLITMHSIALSEYTHTIVNVVRRLFPERLADENWGHAPWPVGNKGLRVEVATRGNRGQN
jgi:hypothetical protein